MGWSSRVKNARKRIVQLFEAQTQRVFLQRELKQIVEENREAWLLGGIPASSVVSYLCRIREGLTEVHLEFPKRTVTRYVWGTESRPLELALSLGPQAYLTHLTAAAYHGLTDQSPKTICVNVEQTPKSNRGSRTDLAQEAIDRAFSKVGRVGTQVADIDEEWRVLQIQGSFTGALGVISKASPEGGLLRLTGLERTLVDAAVRPELVGGVASVLECYRRSREDLSVTKLASLCSKLAFIYPYEQVLGFYLELAGVSPQLLRLFRREEFTLDFYTSRGIPLAEREYSPRWRLYYPKGLT